MAQLALDPSKKHAFHSAGGKASDSAPGGKAANLPGGQRTHAHVNALARFLLSAGTPQQRVAKIEAFEARPGWGPGMKALKKHIKAKQMAQELAPKLQKPAGSICQMITDIKKGRNGRHHHQGLEAVKLFIISKYRENCTGSLFR